MENGFENELLKCSFKKVLVDGEDFFKYIGFEESDECREDEQIKEALEGRR